MVKRQMEHKNSNIEETANSDLGAASGSFFYIPLFQYNAAVEAHKNTLDLLAIVQNDKKELKLDLEAAYKEIDRLKVKLNYR